MEHPVAHGVEEDVDTVSCWHPGGRQQGSYPLKRTGGTEGAQEWLEDTGDQVDETVEQVALWRVFGVVFCNFPNPLDVGVSENRVVNVGNFVADNHLVLAAGLSNGDDPVPLLQVVGVSFGFIF